MKHIKTNTVFILFVCLLGLMTYHWILPENADKKYRPEFGGPPLAWTIPFQACLIETETSDGYEEVLGYTPLLGVDKSGNDLAFSISVALWTNMWLALSAGFVFILLATISGVIIGFDRPRSNESVFNKIRRNKNPLSNFNTKSMVQSMVKLAIQIIHAIPMLLLLLVVVVAVNGLFDDDLKQMFIIMIAIGVLSVPKLALLIQDRIIALEEEEFINAAKASGLSDLKIISTHILWYECSPIIAGQFIYVIIQAIMLEAVISFLGYGFGTDYTSLGGLITAFQGSLPGGAMGGYPLALAPLIILLIIAIVGNELPILLMDSRNE